MAKAIQDYGSFGEWGQDRGAGTLDAIANILSNVSGLMEGKKKRRSEEIKRQALAEYLKSQDVSSLVTPDTKTINTSYPSYQAEGPQLGQNMNRSGDPLSYLKPNQNKPTFDWTIDNKANPIQVASQETKVLKTPEQKIGEMSSEDIMQLLAMQRSGADKEGGGDNINPLSLINAIISSGGIDDKAIQANKPLYEGARSQLLNMAQSKFGSSWGQSMAKGKEVELQRQASNQRNKEEFATTGIEQTDVNYKKWLKEKYPELR